FRLSRGSARAPGGRGLPETARRGVFPRRDELWVRVVAQIAAAEVCELPCFRGNLPLLLLPSRMGRALPAKSAGRPPPVPNALGAEPWPPPLLGRLQALTPPREPWTK
ncbi:unnamed protein product, partial [Prorocentrum cordatum]